MSEEGKERRHFVRAEFPCKITVYTPTQHVLHANTENIGAGGLRVFLEEQLEISSIVGLEIYLDKVPLICQGRIVWVIDKVRRSPNDVPRCDTGIEFYRMKEQDKHVVGNFVSAIFLGSEENVPKET